VEVLTMDRSTALQLAADEMEERELHISPIEILDYVPSDPSRGVLAPPGSVTVFVSQKGAPILKRVREATKGRSGLEVELYTELNEKFRSRQQMTYYQAFKLLRAAKSFATIRYGGRTLATNIFPPPDLNLVVLENPYNGGRLNPNELTLVEHRVPGVNAGLEAVALRHMPPLTKAELAALEQVPDTQLEMNLTIAGECCDSWTDFAQVIIAVTFAVLSFMAWPPGGVVEIAPEEIQRLGPAGTARKLLNIRRELLSHSHA
jgi:hypothetical protein